MPSAASKRVQAMFSQEEYTLLEQYAHETGRSLSAVVRDSVAEHLLADLAKARKHKALAWILSGDDPVSDWSEMEKEIEASRYQCDDAL